eukprot:278509-Prymnesium_polylepis.1
MRLNHLKISPAAPKNLARCARGPQQNPLASRHHHAYLVRTHRRRPGRPGPYALAGEGQGSQRGGVVDALS